MVQWATSFSDALVVESCFIVEGRMEILPSLERTLSRSGSTRFYVSKRVPFWEKCIQTLDGSV